MRTIHMCVSVRGMLQWGALETKRNLRNITKTDGTRYSGVAEFRNELMNELAAGHEFIPLDGDPCEGFDYKKGCPGHEQEAAQ